VQNVQNFLGFPFLLREQSGITNVRLFRNGSPINGTPYCAPVMPETPEPEQSKPKTELPAEPEKSSKFRIFVRNWIERPMLVMTGFFTFVVLSKSVYDVVWPESPELRTYAGAIVVNPATNGVVKVICMLEIVNTGSPSAIRHWRLDVRTKDSKTYSGIFLDNLQKPLPLKFEGKEIPTYYEWLPEKSSSNPIPKGGRTFGFVVFAFEGVSESTLNSKGSLFRLSVRDVQDKEIICDYLMSDEMKPLRFIK
jgi:hypothetical protein